MFPPRVGDDVVMAIKARKEKAMEAYFNELMAKADRILEMKEEDLTDFDREQIKRRMHTVAPDEEIINGNRVMNHAFNFHFIMYSRMNEKEREDYKRQWYADEMYLYLRQMAAQTIADFYHNPDLNGEKYIIADTLQYLEEIKIEDFEDFRKPYLGKLEEALQGTSYNQKIEMLSRYGHTYNAANRYLNVALDLLLSAIHKLGLDDDQAIRKKINVIAGQWEKYWMSQGTDNRREYGKARAEQDEVIHKEWTAELFPENPDAAEPVFSEKVMYEDARKHAGLFNRAKFKTAVKYFASLDKDNPKYKLYKDSEESAIQYIKASLDNHYRACKFQGLDKSKLDAIVAESVAPYYHIEGKLPDLQTAFTHEFLKPKDKVTSKTFDGKNELFAPEEQALRLEKENAKYESTAFVQLGIDEQMENVSMRPLTQFESAVHDAIISLYVKGGNEFMTLSMINRAMQGNPKAKLGAEKAKDIHDAVISLIQTTIRIRKDEDPSQGKFVFTGHLVEGYVISHYPGTIRGKAVPDEAVLHVLATPVLYCFAEQRKQVITGPMAYLNVPLNQNKETTILRDYLLRRISWSKGSQKVPILYDTLFSKMGIDCTDRKSKNKLSRIKKKSATILDYWKERGLISSYWDELEDGRKAPKNRRAYRLVIQKNQTSKS